MLDIDPNTFIQTLSIIGLAIISIVVAYKKITKDWKVDATETSIISLMHNELQRMSKQNSMLSTEIGRLHENILTLNRQLHELTTENQRLQSEVIALTNEVSDLKDSMLKKGANYATS